MVFAPAVLAVSLLAQPQAPMPPTLTIVTLESLVANYPQYDNHEIVVAGIVITGLEGWMMYLPIPSLPLRSSELL
jgi:hypothetical protein